MFEETETDIKSDQTPVVRGIYLGSRGEDFRMRILDILKIGKVSSKYKEILTSEAGMKAYSAAFTSEVVDEFNNYQIFVQLGDLTGNKFIVNYIYQRFPFLRCAEGVKVAARLRINYGSKNEFCKVAESLGFWPFISASLDARSRRKKDLLEDVFEAFLGATEMLLDSAYTTGFGYAVCYKLLTRIYDRINISLEYEDLFDAKTRLKELFDLHSEKLGNVVYTEEVVENGVRSICQRKLQNGSRVRIAFGIAPTKAAAQQASSEEALRILAQQGFVKKPPALYGKIRELLKAENPKGGKQPETDLDSLSFFSAPLSNSLTETTKEDVLRILQNQPIDSQLHTRGKSKYRILYTSTALGMYCRRRDLAGIRICLEMGANPNEKDVEGLTCSDLLVIGGVDRKLVKKVLKWFSEKEESLLVSREVFENYYKPFYSFKKIKIVVE